MVTLQLLANQKFEVKQSRFNSEYACDHVYIHMYTIAQELSIFTFFYSFPSCQYIETILLGKKLFVGFELAPSILRVLGLTHYTTMDDIVILLPL